MTEKQCERIILLHNRGHGSSDIAWLMWDSLIFKQRRRQIEQIIAEYEGYAQRQTGLWMWRMSRWDQLAV